MFQGVSIGFEYCQYSRSKYSFYYSLSMMQTGRKPCVFQTVSVWFECPKHIGFEYIFDIIQSVLIIKTWTVVKPYIKQIPGSPVEHFFIARRLTKQVLASSVAQSTDRQGFYWHLHTTKTKTGPSRWHTASWQPVRILSLLPKALCVWKGLYNLNTATA